MSIGSATILASACFLFATVSTDKQTIYSIDSKQSKLEIAVSREGFLKAFGHDHAISATRFTGEVRVSQPTLADSSVSFTVETNSLVVVDPGESEKDRHEVQVTMLSEQVLDAVKYPKIEFSSSVVRSVTRKGDSQELQLEGVFHLHGTQKTVMVPVELRQQGETLSADGEVSLLQTDFGMTPVKVGGGAVRVKDKLKISFHLVARPAAEPTR